MKEASGTPKFTAIEDVQVSNQCNTVRLEVKKSLSLLVPTNKSLVAPVSPPGATAVNHYLCYQAKLQAKLANGTLLPKFPRGLQVEVADQLQSRRYDLKRITKLCTPANKSGSPVYLAPPSKGSPALIAPAIIQNPTDHLVCCRAQLAKTDNGQPSCVAALNGSAITQLKHTKVPGMHLNNQFGPERLDSVKEVELCIPSQRALLAP